MKKASLLLMLLVFCNTFAKTSTKNTYSESESNSVQILRLNFTAPNGASRELLLGFTSDNSATDGVDYGYDATVSSPFANDLNWIIENDRYVIQGVGAFDNTKQYTFGLFSEVSGSITIELTSLEGFDTSIDVFIYDSLLDTYTNINDTAYTNTIDAGNYTERFYIAFKESESNDENNELDLFGNSNSSDLDSDNLDADNLSILNSNVKLKNSLKISYTQSINEIKISAKNTELINEVNLYNYNGTQLQSLKNINKNVIDILPNTNNKNLIVHIITENETVVKQIVLKN